MSSIKETLKNCKSVKNSDEILDELFSSIKEEKKSSDDDEDESDNEGSDESSEDERKKHKKSKKKKKKHKKKKKKRKRSADHSEERDVKPPKKIKKEKSDKDGSDSFWGDGNKPFETSESQVSNGHSEVKRERSEARYKYEESERRDDRYERREKEYNDERKPVDLGREARPYPTGLSVSSSSHRDRDYRDYYDRGYSRGEGYSREPYDRERWERREYDRHDDRDRYSDRDRDRYRDYHREPRDRRPYDRDDRRGYEREARPREEYHRMKEKARESYKSVKETTEPKKKKSRSRSKEETNGEGGGGDSFWDSKWEGMQLDEKLRKAEHKGRYYLNTEKRYKDTMGDRAKEDSVSLSPSPERVDKSKEVSSKKKDSDSESDTEEFKRLKEMKKVQNFVVKGDGMVEGPIADTSNFEYDPVTRMYKKKDGLVELETRRNYKDEEKKKEDDKWKSDDELEKEKKENEKKEQSKDEGKKEETKDKVEKDEIMDELVKEIEELENEVDTDQEKEADKDKGGIDWGSSALVEILTEKEKEERKAKKEEEKRKKKEEKELKKALEEEEKRFRKTEDGEISDGVEDGEVSSGDERKRTKYTRASKRSKSRSRTRRRSYSRGRDSRDRYSSSRSYRRRSRSSSRDRYSSRRRSPYDRDRDRDRYSRRRYSRSRSRSRTRSRSRERRARAAEERYNRMIRKQERHLRSKINKEKLLEIAKKNANKILKSGGDFMGMDQDRLVAMKAGGSSLDELTKFCKELAKKGLADGDRIDMLAESESDSEEEFHHPFMVKDKPLPNPITMMIGEQKETLTPTARAVAKSQRMLEFPVSSGNAHRSKADGTKGDDGIGEWEPVQTSSTLSELARPALVAPIDLKDDDDEMLKFHEQMEQEEKDLREEAAKTLWTLNEEDKDITVPKGKDFFKPAEVEVVLDEQQLAEIERLKPKPSKLAEVLKAPAPLALPAPKLTTPVDVAEPEVSADPDKVFDTVKAPVVDIGTIVSRRLNAMRKLQANPSDAEALAEMYDAQQMMSDWAGSKNKPGQFVGSTGARVLSKGELNLGLQCWAKADQFHKAEKVKGGFGEFMLKKMGWKDGEGLGRFKSGEVNPLTLDIKFDKKGLMAAEETKKGREVVTMTACKDLSGKHPVSALTELCSKRRWGPPIFTQAFECGPPHKKQYVYKVNVNGADYMPTVAVDNKKKAKANAAMACLQQMGLVPKDPDNPV